MTNHYTYKQHIIDRQTALETAFFAQYQAGHYTFTEPLVILNPYLITPLTALILFDTPDAPNIHLMVKGQEIAGDIHFDFPAATTQIIPVYGLYANYRNEVVLTLPDGTSQTIFIQTEAAPADIPVPDYVQTTPAYFEDHMMFVSPSSFSKMVAYDYRGDLRWYITLDVVFDIKWTANGHLLLATERLITLPYVVTGIYEMSMLGKIYKEYRLPGGTHHDYLEIPGGNIVALTQDLNRDTVEDMCVLLDRATGQIIETWDLKPLLPPEAAAGNRANSQDWLHNNAVWYDQASNSLSFSGRNLDAIVNLDFTTGELNWILGDPDKWPADYVAQYFFSPDTQKDFEWFYAQHACMILPDGDVFLLDNGAWRSKYTERDIPSAQKYSRGVRYRLNHAQRTVQQIWAYGKERGSEFFTPHISNVDYYGEDHYLVHAGDIGQLSGVPCDKPPIFYLGKPEEKDLTYYSLTTELQNDQLVYEMKISDNAYYRAKKMKLYCAADQLTFGPGLQLGTLGISTKTRVRLPETAAGLLPEHYLATVNDEKDRFSFSVLLDAGTYAVLVLQNTKNHCYTLPTIEKDEMAMCVGAFQPKDTRETLLTISKEGLSGKYVLKLLIEQQLFDTGFTVEA